MTATAGPTGSGQTRTPSLAVEEALLAAAERVLIRDGLGAVTVRTVAAEAGVAPMGVYSRFGGKEGLLAAMARRGLESLCEAISAAPDELDPLRRLKAAGLAYRDFGLSHSFQYHLIFDAVSSAQPLHPEVEAGARTTFAILERLVLSAIAAEAIGPVDVGEVTQQLWSALHGAVSLELSERVFAAKPAESYERLLDLILDGIRAAP
jgi:AcrR family transcriptional regulator